MLFPIPIYAGLKECGNGETGMFDSDFKQAKDHLIITVNGDLIESLNIYTEMVFSSGT